MTVKAPEVKPGGVPASLRRGITAAARHFFFNGPEPLLTTLRCAIEDKGWPMQMSIDGLLVALLVVLGPEQEAVAASDRTLAGLGVNPQVQQEKRDSGLATDAAACRYFADPEARRKCAIRTSRPVQSGSTERNQDYPESVIWLTPAEPAMPYKFNSNTPR